MITKTTTFALSTVLYKLLFVNFAEFPIRFRLVFDCRGNKNATRRYRRGIHLVLFINLSTNIRIWWSRAVLNASTVLLTSPHRSGKKVSEKSIRASPGNRTNRSTPKSDLLTFRIPPKIDPRDGNGTLYDCVAVPGPSEHFHKSRFSRYIWEAKNGHKKSVFLSSSKGSRIDLMLVSMQDMRFSKIIWVSKNYKKKCFSKNIFKNVFLMIFWTLKWAYKIS